MSSYWQIQFDFNEARHQANKLDDIAQKLRNLAKRQVENSIDEVPSFWTGKSASLFMNKQSEMKQNILDTARELEEQADNIRRIAQLIYEAEQRALEIAQKRDYKG